MGHCCRSSWRCNRLTDADRAMGASAVRALTRRRVTDHRGRVTPVQRGAVCGRHRRRKHHHSAATARCRLMSDQRKRPSQTVGERASERWCDTTQHKADVIRRPLCRWVGVQAARHWIDAATLRTSAVQMTTNGVARQNWIVNEVNIIFHDSISKPEIRSDLEDENEIVTSVLAFQAFSLSRLFLASNSSAFDLWVKISFESHAWDEITRNRLKTIGVESIIATSYYSLLVISCSVVRVCSAIST